MAVLVHSVDAVLTGEVPAGEEKLEVQPSAEADDHRVGNITGSSGVSVGQQLAILVHSVDAVLTGYVPAGEEKLELQPPAKSDDHRTRNITGSSGVSVGQQLAVLVHSVDAVLTGDVPAGKEKLEILPSAKPDGHRGAIHYREFRRLRRTIVGQFRREHSGRPPQPGIRPEWGRGH